MNKLFTRVAKLVLGLSLAAGVGVAASNNKARSVDAAVGDEKLVFDSDVVVTNSSYGAYDDDDWDLNAGGNNVSAGWNKTASNAKQVGSTYAIDTTVTATTYGWVAATKSAVTNVGKLTFVYAGGSGNGSGKLWLASSSDGSTYTKVTLTSGTQGSSCGSTNTTYTFEFTTISSAYYAIIVTGGASGSAFRFDNVTAKLLEGATGGEPTPTTFSVTYDGNGNTGGTVPTDDTEYESGDEVIVSSNVLTKTNYTFGGWSDGTNTYQPGGTFNIASNTTLTAVWTPNLVHAGTSVDPYSVADARLAIDANYDLSNAKYVTGVVSEIINPWGQNNYQNITFDIIDEGGSDTFRVYRCVDGDADASDVRVDDTVVAYGTLTKYNSTYEFNQGCTLEVLTHPIVPHLNINYGSSKLAPQGVAKTIYGQIENDDSYTITWSCETAGVTLSSSTSSHNGEITITAASSIAVGTEITIVGTLDDGSNTSESLTLVVSSKSADSIANAIFASEAATLVNTGKIDDTPLYVKGYVSDHTEGKKFFWINDTKGTTKTFEIYNKDEDTFSNGTHLNAYVVAHGTAFKYVSNNNVVTPEIGSSVIDVSDYFELQSTSIEVVEGESENITISNVSGGNVSWSGSAGTGEITLTNTSNSGATVTGDSIGSATITVSVGNYSEIINVNVVAAPATVTGLEVLDNEANELTNNQTVNLVGSSSSVSTDIACGVSYSDSTNDGDVTITSNPSSNFSCTTSDNETYTLSFAANGDYDVTIAATADSTVSITVTYHVTGIVVSYTNSSSLVPGTYYIKHGSYYFNGTITSGHGTGTTAKPNSAGEFTFALVGNDTWSIINGNNERLGFNANSTGAFAYGDNYTFKVYDTDTVGVYHIQSLDQTTRYIGWYESSHDFRSYASNQEINITLESTSVLTYTISYEANGGEGTMDNTSGANPVVATCTFTYSGHSFVKWNTQTDGQGTDYAVGTSVSADVTLYAIWEVAAVTGDIDEGRYYIINSALTYGLNAEAYSANPSAVNMNPQSGSVELLPFSFALTAADTYSISTSDGDYLYCNTSSASGNNNNIRTKATSADWYVKNFSEDANGIITCNLYTRPGTVNRFLCLYNSQDWRGYVNNEDTTLKLIPEGYYANKIVEGLNENGLCDNGINAPSTTSWSNLASITNIDNEFAILRGADYTVSGSGAQTVVTAKTGTTQDYAEAVARYDYIVGKYNKVQGLSAYNDFLGRNPSPVGGARVVLNDIINENTNTVAIIVIVSLVSVTAIGGYFFLKKRREQN